MSLTDPDAALRQVLGGLTPVAPVVLPLWRALGFVAAAMPPLAQPVPSRTIALRDGYALRAIDLAGASSYAPLPLAALPHRVAVGDALPEGCDCVVDVALIDIIGKRAEALGEAIPGEGARRIGEDFAAGTEVITAGRVITAYDTLVATCAGLAEIAVRRPQLDLVNSDAASDETATTDLIAALAREAGADVMVSTVADRNVEAISAALHGSPADLLVTVGGTGAGPDDVTVAALAANGAVLSHGLALRPGMTAAIGRWRDTPVLALPGMPGEALAAWLVLGQPVLDALAARAPRRRVTKPLSQKIASTVGVMEIALVKETDDGWLPLAIGDLPLHALVAADAFVVVPSASEGFARGAMVAAEPLHGEGAP